MPRSRRFSNQKARNKFVSDVRIDILRLGKASDIRRRYRTNLFATLKRLIKPHFDRYAETLAHIPNFDEWCDENVPPIIEEIYNAE